MIKYIFHLLKSNFFFWSAVYSGAAVEDSSMKSPLMADLIKRSASFRWSDKSSSSFRSLKKKIQDATSDFRQVGW